MAKFTEKACSQSFAAGRKVLQKLEDEFIPKNTKRQTRAVARALIGGGGVYSYIRVMPDGFLLKSVVFKLISKEISRADHEYMNIHPPPPN